MVLSLPTSVTMDLQPSAAWEGSGPQYIQDSELLGAPHLTPSVPQEGQNGLA